MAKPKTRPKPKPNELLVELDRRLTELKEGKGDWSEFWSWWDANFGIKGKGILDDLLKRRELARGWNSKPKRRKSS